jgi:hypothetical protein
MSDGSSPIWVMIPYRAQREFDRAAQLRQLTARLHALFGPNNVRVVVAEQSDDGRLFNRGKCLNVAYDLAKREAAAENLPFERLVFNDVDLVPAESLARQYSDAHVPGQARHMCGRGWGRCAGPSTQHLQT